MPGSNGAERRGPNRRSVRIAALADLHCSKGSQGQLAPLFAAAAAAAEVLVMCGDLTDYGQPEEAHVLVKELTGAKIPMIAVLGNHDHESGKHEEVTAILCEAGVNVLDGEACEFHGIGFAGVKGFGGGFGQRMLSAWGESAIKNFVHEAVEEGLRLERALQRLTTRQRIALLHYAPIRATIEGESPETYAFLGSSRLEEPLTRYPVAAVFHGHAHVGSPEGTTSSGVPVYNVSLPLMRKHYPDRPPFRIFEVRAADLAETSEKESAAA
jgi:Icc-related predicted phosphoesterase